jgi:hypothetical protein
MLLFVVNYGKLELEFRIFVKNIKKCLSQYNIVIILHKN